MAGTGNVQKAEIKSRAGAECSPSKCNTLSYNTAPGEPFSTQPPLLGLPVPQSQAEFKYRLLGWGYLLGEHLSGMFEVLGSNPSIKQTRCSGARLSSSTDTEVGGSEVQGSG